jgi:ATP-dependent helicase Lhr and Lhr-like helicase
MSLADFHPAVSRWFQERLGEPTPVQTKGWEAIRRREDTLITAPTGSGKTLAAFLIELDELLRESLSGALPDETRVVYVSPLKALSADIHKNLAEPRREIRRLAGEMGLGEVRITAAVRSGDTPASERASMLKTPPHILVTTPESLYLLLTAERSRKMLSTVRTVIVDEIHAVLDSRRGAHLALSLERLEHVAGRKLQRIGLSATVNPVELVADWLVGSSRRATIINEGHRRTLDLALELPGSPLEAVMEAEVWLEIYNRLTELINQHKTTIVFVNTRKQAERVARHLAERVGEEFVTAHHGSLSKEIRLEAEEKLKTGKLKALVATASLELGIDIGHVDLVCQLGSPHRISAFLQRVGRSGHTVTGTPRGRLFPLSRDDLVECAALLRWAGAGVLDKLWVVEHPSDVLAQQIVAESAAEDWAADDLFALVRGAYPYRELSRPEFDQIVQMVAQGFTTRRGRRGALVHYDGVNRRLRGRRGARMLALTSGGAIPETADYRVLLEPEGTFIGTLNEDFAIESMAGDVFQLGNASWRMLRIQAGTVRVEDAHGEPPGIPFWLGEAPARSDELSAAVAELRHEVERRLGDRVEAEKWLTRELAGEADKGNGSDPSAAFQIIHYLADAHRILGVLPTQDTIVAERFFDQAGGMQLVIHAPFGSRINKAWGLSLRKRFCRSFNFELQAAATEDGIVLSLGPQHSFPLESVFDFLHPGSVREVLIQALLDAPLFGTRWRWNGNISLAIPRYRGGKKVPPQIQRMEADDLLAAVFPDAAACLENIAGDREIPDHPLASQTITDCLTEAMDLDGLIKVLERLRAGEITCVARDLPEPSPLSSEILNARPYAFLDDAPLEERRTQAVYTRRAFEPSSADDLGTLDPQAIDRVREQAWPGAENADELHDALLTSGFILESEAADRTDETDGADGVRGWDRLFEELVKAGRASRVSVGAARSALWVATERLPEVLAVHPLSAPTALSVLSAPIAAPTRDDSVRELLRGRLEIVGPTTAAELAGTLGIVEGDVDLALAALEREGVVLRGRFTPGAAVLEWCDRRLLARIHRYTLDRLRAEIEPVSAADFMRFLFRWQRVDPEHRVSGLEGLAGVLEQLDGFEVPAKAWEPDVLAARCSEYDPALLDMLCLTGRVAWARLSAGGNPAARPASRPIRSTPVALPLRQHLISWLAIAPTAEAPALSSYARDVLAVLSRRGASFFTDLTAGSGLLATQVEQALAELAAAGLVTSDSFTGLRALLTPSDRRKPLVTRAASSDVRRHRTVNFGIEGAGRWSLLHPEPANQTAAADRRAEEIELLALTLLARYGVVFRRLLARESLTVPWRELLQVYRRLEARGEIRGGRFVAGMQGEQFARPEAVAQLRAVRRANKEVELVVLSAADPLNLTGLITPGDRISAVASNRIAWRSGVPVAALEANEVRWLRDEVNPEEKLEIERALARKRISPALRGYLGMTG